MKLTSLRSAFFFHVLAFASACTTSKKLEMSQDLKTLEKPLPGIEAIRYQLSKVESSNSSKAMVTNRHRYLKDLFQQSKDPYFGTDRWSADCMSRNKIYDLETNADGFKYRAQLTASQDLRTGFCTEGTVDVVQLVGQCQEQGIFYEITLRGDSAIKSEFSCPDRLTAP
jgi:hypothetical protein